MRKWIAAFLLMYCYLPTVSWSQQIVLNDYIKADSLCRLGDPTDALPILRQLLSYPVTDSLKAEIFARYGYCQKILNRIDSSIFFYKEAVIIWEKQNNLIKLNRMLYNIGSVYQLKKDYVESLAYFKNALEYARHPADSVVIYIGICVSHLKQKHIDTAYFLVKDVLLKFPPDIATDQSYYILQVQGVYLKSIKQFDSALYYLKAAGLVATDDAYKAPILNDIAETYREKEMFKLAFIYQDSSAMLNAKNGNAENLQFDYDTYTSLYEDIGDFRKALDYSKKGRSLSDSFFDVEKNNALLDAEAKYQNQKTLAAKAIVEKDNVVKQRNLILTFVALCLVAVLAFVAFRNTRIKQKANTLLTQQKQQVQQLADQLAVANDTKARLFSTIGHDLRSPISSLYASLKMQELKGYGAGGEMSEQTVRLLDTLEELLIWSKSQMDGFKVQPVKINVRYFFEDLKEFYTAAAEAKNISIVNDTAKDVVIRADENLLKTIFRNAISNAIANTLPGNMIQLHAQPVADGTICLAVNNPCEEESFQKFNASFNDAVVKSGAYGLGIVLMKEFAQKLGGQINLVYTDGHASLRLCI